MYFLGDIGGTKIRLAFAQNQNKIEKFLILRTPQNYKDFLNLIRNISQNYKFKKAVFGFAGNFDKNKEKLIYAPNLKDYQNKNLKRDLEKILNCPVLLENDAALAGLGEAKFGAGKKYKIIAYITLSTGIGGVKIVNQRIAENFYGFEPGHSYFLINFQNFSYFSQIEDLISGSALEKIFGKKPEEIKNKKIWEEIHQILAMFLVNVSLFWSPEVIILGGGISESINFKKLNQYFQDFHPIGWKIKIIKVKLKNKGGIYGDLALITDY